MVPLTGQNTINDMVDRINEVSQEIENVTVSNANAVVGPASSVTDQIMAFSDTTGKNAKAANISPFVYSVLDDVDDVAIRETLGLKSAAVLDAATTATPSTVVQRDASGNIAGVAITASSGFSGNGSQITSLNMGNVASGTLGIAYGGTGAISATGTGSTVRNTSPTFAGIPLSNTPAVDTNTTQIATTAFVIGQASSSSPLMNGTTTIGTSLRYARADHVHASDTTKVNTSLLGVANGVATLDSAGKVPTSQLPAYVDDVLEYTNLASFPATGETGKIYVALDTNKTYRWSGSAYIYITSGAVDSVAGKTGVVTLVKGDVGLGNVDNTSDVNKPVSTAQQSALGLKANIASPALTGVPTAPTASASTSTTQLATTAFVHSVVNGVLNITGLTGGTRVLTADEAAGVVIFLGGTLTSNLILEIPTTSNRLYSISNGTTGAFTVSVRSGPSGASVAVAQGKRNLVFISANGAYDAITDFDSIALSGAPTAPTAAVGTNTTQIATTAFVNTEIANDAPTKTGGGASGTWGISVTGNAATATAMALGSDAVNIDNLTGNGVVTNVTANTTGTFIVFQQKNGVILTYNDGTNRTQIHYANNGLTWIRSKAGAAAYSVWAHSILNESATLSAGSCTFNGNGAITMLRNNANLIVGRDSAGVYSISNVFGTMVANMPVVAMTNTNGRVNITQGGNGTNLKLTTYGYNNATPFDTTYLNVILGN